MSTRYRTIPIIINAIDIIIISKFKLFPIILSTILSNIKLNIPAGTVAITKYQNIFPSVVFSFFTTCLYPPAINLIQSLKKYTIIASNVPICKATSNDSGISCHFSSQGNKFKCAELDIGKNSVSPCTVPKIIACIIVICYLPFFLIYYISFLLYILLSLMVLSYLVCLIPILSLFSSLVLH